MLYTYQVKSVLWLRLTAPFALRLWNLQGVGCRRPEARRLTFLTTREWIGSSRSRYIKATVRRGWKGEHDLCVLPYGLRHRVRLN